MWKYNLKYNGILYVLRYDLIEWVLIPYYKIKYFIQRGKRGYSERDLWDLEHHLSFILSNALLDMVKISHGSPCRAIGDIPNCCKDCNCHELWKKELKENAEKFRLLYKNEWYNIEQAEESWKQEEKTYKEATEWLAKWYGSLWD